MRSQFRQHKYFQHTSIWLMINTFFSQSLSADIVELRLVKRQHWRNMNVPIQVKSRTNVSFVISAVIQPLPGACMWSGNMMPPELTKYIYVNYVEKVSVLYNYFGSILSISLSRLTILMYTLCYIFIFQDSLTNIIWSATSWHIQVRNYFLATSVVLTRKMTPAYEVIWCECTALNICVMCVERIFQPPLVLRYINVKYIKYIKFILQKNVDWVYSMKMSIIGK